jgi:hypothetical protein
MLPIEDLRWTTRADVCARLIELLISSTPTSSSPSDPLSHETNQRRCVASLLATIADETCATALREILLNPCEDRYVRLSAAKALARLRIALLPCELKLLLEDRHLWDGCFRRVLALCRTEEAQRIARDHLAGWPAADRAALLSELVGPTSDVAPELGEWLYVCWLREDRHSPESDNGEFASPRNVVIARRTDERPESQALLIEFWRQAEGDERRRRHAELSDDEGELTAAVAHNPQEMRELAEAFVLCYESLAAYFGSDQVLLDQIEASIRKASQRLHASPDDDAGVSEAETERAWRLLRKLREVDVRSRIASLLACPDLHPRLSKDLFFVFYGLDRCCAEALARKLAETTGKSSFAGLVLLLMGRKALRTQPDFLLWAGRQPDRTLRYRAVERVDAAGGRLGEWHSWLEERSRDEDPFVRLRATAALLRRGMRSRLPEIVRAATGAQEVLVRGEAIRLLGLFDPEPHVALFRRALLKDREKFQHSSMPAADAAVLALAHLGTPAALTALLQGYFVPWGEEIPYTIEHYLEILLREPGADGWRELPSRRDCGYTLSQYLEGKAG